MKSNENKHEDLQIEAALFRERLEELNKSNAIQKSDLEAKYKALIESLTKAKPNDRSLKDRDFAVAVTKVQEAYAWYNTYCK